MGNKIKKGDTVEVISGKERGKRGKILKVLSATGNAHVLVENLNIIKKHTKPNAKNKEGGIIDMEAALDISNVMLVCSKCGKAVRTGFKTSDNKSIRYCKKCNEVID